MDKEGAERYYIRTLEDLCRHLDSNGPLRDALLWELASDSEAVKKIADIRELENESLLAYYRKYFKGTGLDISGVTAVLIAGIYYLYLHRSKSTFCGLDLNTEKDSRRLLRLLSRTVHTLFAEAGKSTSDDSVRNAELARRMEANGLNRAAICDILDLTPDELAALLPE